MSTRLDLPVRDIRDPRAATPSPQRPVAARRLAPARPSRLRDGDLAWMVATYVALVTGMWTVHGGLAQFGEGTSGIALAITQLSGLWASAVGLVGLIFTARPALLERRFGLDRLFNWHRILGEAMAVLVGVHVAAAVMAWQVDGNWGSVISDLTGREPYMAGATVGALLIGIVTVTSLRSVRNRLAYETWYLMHLTAYLAFGLSFGHQIVMGSDLSNDTVARWAWIGLHLVVAAALVVGRWGRTLRSVVQPLRVASVQQVSPDVYTVRLRGRRLHSMQASPGQFCFLRPMVRHGWWRCNPYSLSAAPSTDGLRFSVKVRGDASSLLTSLPVGSRVAVDGPYGVCTPEVIEDRKVLFIVGGVGVAPARAMLEDLPVGAEPVVLYRAHHASDLIHADELAELVNTRNGRLHTLVGPSATLAVRDPFGADTLRRAVPDVADRVAILCGPDRLLSAARSGLRAAGMPTSRMHYEHAWW